MVLTMSMLCTNLQVSFEDFKEFASLRKELHKLQVALEFYQKTTGQFGLADLKVGIVPTLCGSRAGTHGQPEGCLELICSLLSSRASSSTCQQHMSCLSTLDNAMC